ncbi:MAG: PRC-barrel domain-containing protein [Methanobacterium sp.]|jgi:sporulation protein YlmC with PRC-barrel domain|uniref:Photosystem reaction center subunit H n=1 Tax=Methanobacterium subterraneum TaxID=59277 RepID=A0A2H4VN40_9EURY|nr:MULTISPECIES: PRC-barrel domain-containing protein [Methanobacterium]AUB59523.1 photosystem reaction center subunit H [Methanobacterium subterraneum]MBW4257202.1 PRC-barrel domain-containing protein [Methanobacterium sp. YSL]MCC7560221.1 PRC-barrel domain-containing protein [Methanobacterium sp.]
MKVSDFFGRRVLDKKANEIGKIADMVIKPKEGIITSMIISTSDFGLTRKDLEIVTADIEEVGDYVLLNIEKEELKARAESGQKKEKLRLDIKK